MERDLKNKVVVITGGAEGIGFAIGEQFLQQGANVIILDINEVKGVETGENFKLKYGKNRVEFMKCDVTKDLERISKIIFGKYEKVDVLVNNAGIVNEDDIRKTLDVNTIAVIEWTIKFREHMRKDKGGIGGTIINISSIYGFTVNPYSPFYKASKFAVMGFTKTLGHEKHYEKTGVRIVALCPGFTYSSLTLNPGPWGEFVEEAKEYMKTVPWQSIEAVGKTAAEVFKIADSGTAWVVNGNQPVEQV